MVRIAAEETAPITPVAVSRIEACSRSSPLRLACRIRTTTTEKSAASNRFVPVWGSGPANTAALDANVSIKRSTNNRVRAHTRGSMIWATSAPTRSLANVRAGGLSAPGWATCEAAVGGVIVDVIRERPRGGWLRCGYARRIPASAVIRGALPAHVQLTHKTLIPTIPSPSFYPDFRWIGT